MTSVFCTSTSTPIDGSTRDSASTASTEWKKRRAGAAVRLGDLDAHHAEVEQLVDERGRRSSRARPSRGRAAGFRDRRTRTRCRGTAVRPRTGRSAAVQRLGVRRSHHCSMGRGGGRAVIGDVSASVAAAAARYVLELRRMASAIRTMTPHGSHARASARAGASRPSARRPRASAARRRSSRRSRAAAASAAAAAAASRPSRSSRRVPQRHQLRPRRRDRHRQERQRRSPTCSRRTSRSPRTASRRRSRRSSSSSSTAALPTRSTEPPREIRSDYDEESEAARDDVRLFAIFLDDYHVRRGASMAVRKPLDEFIETQLGPTDMVGVMYPLESLASIRMTRNHDGDRASDRAVPRPQVRLHAAEPVRGAVRALSGRDGRADPQPGVDVGASRR